MKVAGFIFFIVFSILAIIGWIMVAINHEFSILPMVFNCLQIFFSIVWRFGDDIDEFLGRN